MSVALRHPRTGEVKVLPDGWSWGCFLGSGILGLPLYRRGLQIWGSTMVVFNVVALVVALVPTERAAILYGWMSVVGLGLSLYFGMMANAMAVDRYLAQGWEYAPRGRAALSSSAATPRSV